MNSACIYHFRLAVKYTIFIKWDLQAYTHSKFGILYIYITHTSVVDAYTNNVLSSLIVISCRTAVIGAIEIASAALPLMINSQINGLKSEKIIKFTKNNSKVGSEWGKKASAAADRPMWNIVIVSSRNDEKIV